MDKVFSAFDERIGPVAIYSTIKDPVLTKKIAVKSIVSTLTSVQTSTSEKLEGEAIIPFPDENKLAFIFYTSLDQKTEGGENRVVSLCAIVETEHKSLLYSNATSLSQEASKLKISLNKSYKYGQELPSDIISQLEAWGVETAVPEAEVIAEKQIAFNIHSLFDLFPVKKSLRKTDDPLVPLFLGIFLKVPVVLVGPNVEFLLEIADLLRGYLPNEELDVRLAISLHAESLHHAISYGIPRADLILLNEDQYRNALFYREPVVIVRIGRDPRYDNYRPPSKAIEFIEELMKKIRGFRDSTVCDLYLQGEFMRIESFKALNVYKRSIKIAMQIFTIVKEFPVEEKYSLSDQILRSSRSVAANIAEAWRKRRYKKAFISKLNDAESEAAETRVWIEISQKCDYIDESTAIRLDDEYDHILGQLTTMIIDADKWVL